MPFDTRNGQNSRNLIKQLITVFLKKKAEIKQELTEYLKNMEVESKD
jgi:hypothetical protein